MANEDVAALEGYRNALLSLPANAAVDAAAVEAPSEELAALNPNSDARITRDEALRYVDGLLRGAPATQVPPSYDGVRAAFIATDRLVTKASGARPPLTQPTAPSRRSLLEMVDTLWPRRDQPISENDVYRLYSAPRESNPLTIPSADYLARLGRLAAERPPDAISNVQGLRLRPPEPNNAVTLIVNAAASGAPEIARNLDRTFFRFERAGWRPAEIRERVYVHAAANHATDVAAHIVREIIDRPNAFPGVEMAKVAGPTAAGGRSENIVIYTDGPEAAERVVAALRRYHQNNPTHFMRTTNMMTEQRLPGVSLGAEPAPPPELRGPFSFGSLRSAMIAEAFRELRERQPTMSRADFVRHLDSLLKQAGVDPERPHRNLERGPQR